MKKVVLIDGNNILFRSYYATAYGGNILRNSKGFPTNALYGFINMINKIIHEEKPEYMMIAFDKGKTFRHEKYKNYKDGRKETPEELKEQFPVAKELTRAMGISCIEIDNYEADDIIGTFAKEVDRDDDFVATIISSDKDLLQLISDDVEVKLLKTNDFIRMNKSTFYDVYGLEPIKMIDLKALMGDSSDNIPGVKGIGEKTALNLLHKYNSLDGVYSNIDSITGKTKEKLINDKENAFFSYELATIYKKVPIDTDLNKIKYTGFTDDYIPILEKYEFYSIINKIKCKDEEEFIYDIEYGNFNLDKECAIYLETTLNYHDKNIYGLAIYNDEVCSFIPFDNIKNLDVFTNNKKKYTYDLKRLITVFEYLNINIDKNIDDLMLCSYLLDDDVKDDISYLMKKNNIEILSTDEIMRNKKITIEEIGKIACRKAKFIWNNRDKFSLLEEENKKLYEEIELPLTYVLKDMEITGVNVSTSFLENMKDELKDKIDNLTNEIYNLSGISFNISSPKQLGKILFDKLSIPYPKKIKDNNYSTSVDILNKLTNYEIVNKVLEYRSLTKIYSNYVLGLLECIKEDGKIHTIFNQALTRTGRLSSSNPNLQNIPVREENGRLIRKAFLASPGNIIISFDYSQIELRIFAHMSKAENMIKAFINDMDIHTKTAMDIYHVSFEEVTKEMRRNAKAVNFGIIYGISGYGLSIDLDINVKDAKKFLDDYLNAFPGIKDYMDKVIKEAHEKGYVKTLFGRKRTIDELKNPNFMIRNAGERMALNTPIQGTSADILKKAMIEIDEEFKKNNLKSKMIIQVHDELIFDALKEEEEIVINIVKNIMENTYKLSVPLKVDVNKGNNFYEAK